MVRRLSWLTGILAMRLPLTRKSSASILVSLLQPSKLALLSPPNGLAILVMALPSRPGIIITVLCEWLMIIRATSAHAIPYIVFPTLLVAQERPVMELQPKPSSGSKLTNRVYRQALWRMATGVTLR
jgi:hypothetical protein